MKQGILCIFSGPPLSGKSTFIGGLKKSLKDLVIVSTDDIRFDLSKDYQFRPELEHLVWQQTYARIADHLHQGHLVCLDATLITPQLRGLVLQRFHQFPVVYFAFIKPSFSLIQERNQRRKWKQIPADVLQKMYDDYQTPTPTEKLYYYRVFDVSYETFTEAIDEGVLFLGGLHGT